MKVFPSLVILALSAAVGQAQQSTAPRPATPPAAAAPATAPTPGPRPAAVFIDGEELRRNLGLPYMDTESIRMNADRIREEALRMATEMKFRTSDFEYEARIAGERMKEDALRVTEQMRDKNWGAQFAPMAISAAKLATTLSSDIGYGIAKGIGESYPGSFNYNYTPVGQAKWSWSQDADPADSLYRVASDAMNRGEYRRSADLFMQVRSKFPKSTRVVTAAYYEALMRYRIGTTDELRTALRVLTENRSTSNTAASNEMSVLTTRVRGALAARGDAEQARIVAADAQKGGCDREDMQVRAEALSALAQSDMAAATPMLRSVLDKKDPCSLDLRRRALSILLRRADTAATSAAIAVARNNDETLELRVDAVRYLSRLPGDNALSTLEDLMKNSTEREVQRAAVSSLSSSENTRARSSVRMLIERSDVSEELRAEALNSFSKDRSTPEDAAYLRGLYNKMQSENLKKSVLYAVSRMGGPENDQFLMGIARNTGEATDVRSSAISRLSRSTSTISVSDLSKLYDAAESRSIRNQVVNALGSRKEPEALDKLVDILKTSTDSSVRNQIVNMLGRNSDPKAKQALADFLGRPL